MPAPRRFRVVICRGPECGDRRGSAALHEVFRDALEAQRVRTDTELVWQSCFGRCTQGPNVLVREILTTSAPSIGSGFATPPGPRGTTVLYNRVDPGRAARIVDQHVTGGRVVREFIERVEHGAGLPAGVPASNPLRSTATQDVAACGHDPSTTKDSEP